MSKPRPSKAFAPSGVRAALGSFLRAAREMQEHGTFTFADEAVSFREINAMFTAENQREPQV